MTSTIITYFAAINAVTFVVSIVDKGFAVYRKRRIPEKLLLALALVGGAVGSKAAQIVSGHKTLKVDFCASLNLIVFLQLGLAAAVWSEVVREDARTLASVFAGDEAEAEEIELVSDEPVRPRRFGPGS